MVEGAGRIRPVGDPPASLTLYYAAWPVPGSSLRDWAAYLFSAGFLVSLAFRPAHFRHMSAALAFSMVMLSDPSGRAAYRRALDERADAYERGSQVDQLVEILHAAQAQNLVRA